METLIHRLRTLRIRDLKPRVSSRTIHYALLVLSLVFLSAFVPPHLLYVAGIFSLLIPVVGVINIFAFFYFLATKQYRVTSTVLCIISVLILSGIYSPLDVEKQSEPAMSILSYNANKLGLLSKNDFRPEFADWVKEKKFSVVALQEMVETERDPFRIEGYEAIFSGRDIGAYHLGLFIFTTYPIVDKGDIIFGAESFNRGVWVDLNTGTDTVRVINVHLRSYDFRVKKGWRDNFRRLRGGLIGRSRHTQMVHDFVTTSPHPVVLCGDFNSMPFSYPYFKLRSKLDDSFVRSGAGLGYTYKVDRIPIRIDYIFTSPGLNTYDYEILNDVTWSDHAPVTLKVSHPSR